MKKSVGCKDTVGEMLRPRRLRQGSSPPVALSRWKSPQASFWTSAAQALNPSEPSLRSFEQQLLRTASSTLVEERSVHAKASKGRNFQMDDKLKAEAQSIRHA